MSKLINKIKFWYKSLNSSKVSFEKKGIRTKKDWNKILFAVFIALCIFGAISFYFYVEIDKGTLFKVADEDISNDVSINNALLSKTIKDINNRETSFVEIKDGKKIPPNPAL